MDSPEELLLQVWTFVGMALACGLVLLGVRFSRWGRPLWPPQRYRAVPWSGPETLIALFLVFILTPALVQGALTQAGFFTWYYGPGFQAPDFAKGAPPPDPLVVARLDIWRALFSYPLQIACIPVLLRRTSGTRPYQLGLTTHRWLANVALGCLGWILLTPLVFGLDMLVNWICRNWLHAQPDIHPLTFLATHQPRPAELSVLVLLAVVLAPMFEELVFRGLLQNWLATRPWGGQIATAGALLLAYRAPDGAGVWPMVFVLAMVPGLVVVTVVPWRWLPHPDAARAIYGTALLFAMFHASVWPTPIPLFVLGLGLGYLAYRTQSLVGVIVLHGLFNAVSAMTFFYLPPEPPPNGKPVTSAVQRFPSASTVTGVPGSWLPRRT